MPSDTGEERVPDATRAVEAAITHDDVVALDSLLQAWPELKSDNLLLLAVRAGSTAVIPLVLHEGRDLHLPDPVLLGRGWTTAWMLAVDAGGTVLNAMLRPGLLSDDVLVDCITEIERRSFDKHRQAFLEALKVRIRALRVWPGPSTQTPPAVVPGRQP